MVIVALEMSFHCGIIIVFDVKYITLESIYDSILCLSYIFNMAPVCIPSNISSYYSSQVPLVIVL